MAKKFLGRNNVNLEAANALRFRLPRLSQMPALTPQMQYKRRSTQQCRPKRYVYFRRSATWYNQGHGSSSSLASKRMILRPPHPHLPAPRSTRHRAHLALFQLLSNYCQALPASHQIPLIYRSAMAANNSLRPLWISRCLPLSKF